MHDSKQFFCRPAAYVVEKYEQKMNNDYSLAKLALGGSPNQLKKFLKKKRKRTRLTWAKDVNMVKWRMETSYII